MFGWRGGQAVEVRWVVGVVAGDGKGVGCGGGGGGGEGGGGVREEYETGERGGRRGVGE